jgi:hypothetical protein
MSRFTDEERAAEEARRKAANRAKEMTTRTYRGPTSICIHCGQAFPMHEGHVGEVSLCDHCLHRD